MTDEKPQPSRWFAGLDLGQASDFSALAVLERRPAFGPVPPPPPRESAGPMGKSVVVAGGQDRPWYEGVSWLPRPGRRQPLKRWRYLCHVLHRWDTHTPYPDVVDQVTQTFLREPLKGSQLAVDKTGVGAAVVDQFVRAAGRGTECPRCGGKGVEKPPSPSAEGPKPSGLFGESVLGAVPCALCGGAGRLKLHAEVRPVTITAGAGVSEDGAGWRVAKKELASLLMVLLGERRLEVHPSLPLAAVWKREAENFRVKVTPAANERYESWREAQHDDILLAVALAAFAGEHVREFWVR